MFNSIFIAFVLQLSAAEASSTLEKSIPSNPVESNIQSKAGIEDLFKDLTVITPNILEKPQRDVKNDIMNVFDKVCHSTILIEFQKYYVAIGTLWQNGIPC